MSETRAEYHLNENGDTEPLAAVKPASTEVEDTEPEPAPTKKENMENKLCEYLASDLIWTKALTEDQAYVMLIALIKNQPTAVQRVIDDGAAEEEKPEESEESAVDK